MALSLFLGNNNQQMFLLFNYAHLYFPPGIQPGPTRHTTGLVLGSVIALESPSPSFFPPICTVCYYTHYLHFSVRGGRFSPPAAPRRLTELSAKLYAREEGRRKAKFDNLILDIGHFWGSGRQFTNLQP